MLLENTKVGIGFAGKRGRGVFARCPIKTGELVEACPLILFSRQDAKTVKQTILDAYIYQVGADKGTLALALGYGSLYNHADKNNADFEVLNGVLYITAQRVIKQNEEITINYGGKEKDFK